MALRPVFMPLDDGPPFVRELPVEFEWFAGLSLVQRQRSVSSLHAAAREQHGIAPVLEVSTRSTELLGRTLSAFELRITMPTGVESCVEAAFQGSKVFEGGGPYTDLYGLDGGRAKRDPRLAASGSLIGFSYGGQDWPLEPPHAFYEWLYVAGLRGADVEISALEGFSGFTDIEFNPAKSWNCQARAVARFSGMRRAGWGPSEDLEAFLSALVTPEAPGAQERLF